MEYETRSLRWYWLILLLIYCGISIYFLLKANPFLYSQGTLKAQQQVKTSESLEPWPPIDGQFALEKKASGEGDPWPFLSFGNLNMTSPDQTRNKSYTEYKSFPLKAAFKGEVKILHQAFDHILLKDEDNWIFNFDFKGNLRWSYGLNKEAELAQVLKDSVLLYLIRKNGSVTALQLSTGMPQWNLETEQSSSGQAWLENEFLILPVEKSNSKKITSSLLKIDRNQGRLVASMDGFEFKQAFKQVPLPGSDTRLVYAGTQVVAFQKPLDDKLVKVLWSTTLPENISGELVTADSQIFVTTEGKRLYVLNAKKKGEALFDLDLDITPAGNLTYLPEMNRLAYLSDNGVMRVIDLKKEEMAWKFDLSIKAPLREIWASRLKGAYIQEFGMKWVDKGWTLWSPCRATMFCVYNPDRGQLIQRIELSGHPIALPVVTDDKIFALVKQTSGDLALAHLLEPSDLRKAQAEDEAEAAKKDEDR